ncbi:MAG: sigma-70 family RNA polymerase sigma factor [Pseudomonadota bacterium]
MMVAINEVMIFEAFRNGDSRRTVELLLDAYQDEVYAYCCRLVGQKDAPKIYQQSIAWLVRDLNDLETSISIRAWLFSIARNVITQHHRKNDFPKALNPNYAPISGPEKETAHRSLHQYLDQLDPTVQEMLQLHLWHNLTTIEVAYVCDIPKDQVRDSLATAMSNISVEIKHGFSTPS